MNAPRTARVATTAFSTALLTAVLFGPCGALAAQQPARPQAADKPSSLARVVKFLEQNTADREAMVSSMSPKVEALQRALGEVDAALAAEGQSDRDRMGHAAQSMDAVLLAIDAVLDNEDETRRLFDEQSRKLTDEWRRASAEGATSTATDSSARAARDQRRRVAAHFALAPDTPEEWRSLFELAFDLLDANAEGDSELAQQQQEIWAETVALLAELRGDVYANYATDISSFQGLRTMRASKLLQKDLLEHGRDLEGLREVSRSLREASQVLVRPDEHGAAITDRLRELMNRSRDARGSSAVRTRSNDERRRAMEQTLQQPATGAGA